MTHLIINILTLAFLFLIGACHLAYADTYRAGLSCTTQSGLLVTHASDAMDDVLACIAGTWQSMVYGKNNNFPKNHPLQTVSLDAYSCSAYTDASGNPYLSMVGAYIYGANAATHVLIGFNGGVEEICMADPFGISINAGMRAGFFPWN